MLPAVLRLFHIDLSTIEVGSVQIQRLADGTVRNIHERHAFVTNNTHTHTSEFVCLLLSHHSDLTDLYIE